MSESPHKAATPAAPARGGAPYTPSGAAASERMLSSVLGRVIGPYGAPIGRALRFAGYGSGVRAQPIRSGFPR